MADAGKMAGRGSAGVSGAGGGGAGGHPQAQPTCFPGMYIVHCTVCLALPGSCPEAGVVEISAIAVPAAPGQGWCGRAVMSRLGAGGPLPAEI